MAVAPTTVNYKHLPEGQFYALYACVWTSSLLSIVGSSLILFSIVRNRQRALKKHQVFERLMFGLSISDLVTSIIMGLQPVLIQEPITALAAGDDRTCKFLGFGMMFILTSYMFSCIISLHFYLSVTASRIDLEPYCHLLPWGTGFLFGTLGIVSGSLGFEPLLGICAFGPLSDNPMESNAEMFAAIIGWMFSSVALIAGLGGIMFTVLVYTHTRRIYQNSQRHVFAGDFQSRFRYAQKREIARRSIMYTAAFMNSFLMNIVNRVANGKYKEDVLDGDETTNTGTGAFILLLIIFWGFPIQGFLNCIVYFQPKVLRWRNRNGSRGIVWAIGQSLTSQDDSSSSQEYRLSLRRSFRSISAAFPSSSRWFQQQADEEEAVGDAIDTRSNTDVEEIGGGTLQPELDLSHTDATDTGMADTSSDDQ